MCASWIKFVWMVWTSWSGVLLSEEVWHLYYCQMILLRPFLCGVPISSANTCHAMHILREGLQFEKWMHVVFQHVRIDLLF